MSDARAEIKGERVLTDLYDMDNQSLFARPHHDRRPGRVEKQQSIEVTIYRGGAEATVNSHMVDFSPTGVGLLHPLRIELGEQFSITLLQPGGQRIKFLYNTIYCNEAKQGGFHVGAEFVCAVCEAA